MKRLFAMIALALSVSFVPAAFAQDPEPTFVFGSGSIGDPRLVTNASEHMQVQGGSLDKSVSAPAPFPSSPGTVKYFGFAGGCDVNSYLFETLPFSNTCTVGWSDPRLLDKKWRALLVANGVKLIVSVHGLLFAGPNDEPRAPFDIRDDAQERWNNALTQMNAGLNEDTVLAWYIADEPIWNGITPDELAQATAIVKASFPRIPTLTSLNHVEVPLWNEPTATDWVAYHQYETADVRTDPMYQSNISHIKQLNPGKPFIYVVDTWWASYRHGANGISEDDMWAVARNFYSLATSDPNAIGAVGFLWPTFVEGTGARDLPRSAILEYRHMGAQVTRKCLVPDSVDKAEQALFFQSCRFFSTVQYWIPWEGNRTGMGVAASTSDDFGTFWFFQDSNVEYGLKLLDGRQVNGLWWTFASGYTSLPTFLKVYRSQDNFLVWSYQAPGGDPPARNGHFTD